MDEIIQSFWTYSAFSLSKKCETRL